MPLKPKSFLHDRRYQLEFNFVSHPDAPLTSLTILGSGPAGLTAALYAARAGIQTQIFCGPDIGGQLTTTSMVENWPGGASDLTGPILMTQMEEQVRRYRVTFHYEEMIGVDLSTYPFQGWTQNKNYSTHALIIATGARARYLNLASESEYMNKGVSACATCDGFFYRNQEVAVVGGGSTALEEALYLTDLASKVHLIHRRTAFRAEHLLQERLQKKVTEGRVLLHTPYQVSAVKGDGQKVTSLELAGLDPAQPQTKQIALGALFVAIGREPCSKWLNNQLKTDEQGFIVTQSNPNAYASATSISGVFAAGDIVQGAYRQAITAAASGCMAALDAKDFLDKSVF